MVDDFGLRRHFPPTGRALRDKWVLFIHGMWEAGGVFDGIWEDVEDVKEEEVLRTFVGPFLQAGYRCAVLVLPGYCQRLPVEKQGAVSFHTYLAAVRQAYDKLNDPIVVGHSLGGLLVQKLIEDVTPQAAVLISPAAPKDIGALKSMELWKFAVKYTVPILGSRPLLPTLADMEELVLNGLPPTEREPLYRKFSRARAYRRVRYFHAFHSGDSCEGDH